MLLNTYLPMVCRMFQNTLIILFYIITDGYIIIDGTILLIPTYAMSSTLNKTA